MKTTVTEVQACEIRQLRWWLVTLPNDEMRRWGKEGGSQGWLSTTTEAVFPLLSLSGWKQGGWLLAAEQLVFRLPSRPPHRSPPSNPSSPTQDDTHYIISAISDSPHDCPFRTLFFPTRFLGILVVAFLWQSGGPDPFENRREVLEDL